MKKPIKSHPAISRMVSNNPKLSDKRKQKAIKAETAKKTTRFKFI